jgi:diguanylate cyclase (GGDEF)-like protein/PAS domain S-box-containing protein
MDMAGRSSTTVSAQPFNLQPSLPARAVVPSVLVVTRDADLQQRIGEAAQRARVRIMQAPPEGLAALDPETITVAFIDERVLTQRTPLSWLSEWIALHGGVDAALVLGASAPAQVLDDLSETFDDVADLDSAEDLLRALISGQRLSAERRASRYSNLAGRAALAALDSEPEYITLLDRQGRRVWTAPALGRDFGIDATSLVGTDYLTSHRRTPTTHLAMVRLYNTAMANPGKLVRAVMDAIRPDGARYLFEARMLNLLEHPEIGVTVVLTREVGLADEHEKRAAAPGISFQTMIEKGPLVTFVNSISPAERIMYASPQSERLLKLPTSAFTDPDFDWLEQIHPEDRERVERMSALADAGLGEITIDYRYRMSDGVYRWLRSVVALALTDEGEEVWIGNLIDIDDDRRSRETAERHDAEIRMLHQLRRLIAQDERLATIFERAAGVIAGAWAFPMIRLYTLEDDLPVLATQAGSVDEQALHPDHRLLISRAIHSGETAVAGPVTTEGDSLVTSGAPPSHLTAEIAVPLIDRDRVIGVLMLGGTRSQPIQPADIAMAETVAEYLSMAAVRARLQDEARQQGVTYQTVVERVRDVIFQISDNLDIDYVNPAWNARLGYPVDQQIGMSLLDVIHPDDRNRVEGLLKELGTGETGMVETETQVLTDDGRALWMELRALTDPRSGTPGDITGMLVDVTDRHQSDEELRQSHERFRQLAFQDPLTSLPNRLVFNDRLQHALAVGARRGTGVAVLFLDLDGFKPVNDLYGHAAGDRVLKTVAERFQERMRSGDTIARFGGDEFAVILEDLSDASQAMTIAAGLIEAMQAPIQVGVDTIIVGVSIGITFLQGRQISTDDAVAEADAALYEAKSGGRGRYALFERPDAAEGGERHRSDLRRGMRSHELTMIYHPIYRLSDRQIVAFEARLRWDHPAYGRLVPGHFLRRADASGLVEELGGEVLEMLANDLGGWLMQGLAVPQLRFTLSGRQALDSDLAQLLRGAREQFGLPGSAFGIEMTDGSSSAEREAIERLLEELRAMDVTVGYDNFGNGSTTLPGLVRIRPDFVNFNVDFLDDVEDREDATAVMQGTLALTKSLGWTLIAKEVHKPDHLDWTIALGIEYAQGDALCPALNAQEFADLLKQQ